MSRLACAALLVLALVLTGCSGSDDASTEAGSDPTAADDAPATAGDDSTNASPTEPGTVADPPVAAEDAAAEEVPQFISDFDRICTTEVGFAGATSYEQVAGIHPVVLIEEQYSGTLIQASEDLPAGWAVEQDSDFEDSSELAATELVACATLASSTANGTTCELDGDDGAVTLTLLDGTWDFSIHAATTGAELMATTLEAATTDCPTFVFIAEGQTEFLNSPTTDQYINALQPFVSP